MSPRWRKVIADLISNPSRSVLVVLCIAIGVIAVGLIEGARELLAENLEASYQAALPATITYSVSPFDDSLLTVVRRTEGVLAAEGRTVYNVRVQTNNGTWRDVQLFAAKDFLHPRVNRLLTVEGIVPPPARQIVLERSSLAFLGARMGEMLLFELPNGKQTTLPIAGVGHDLNQVSTFLTGAVYGYVTPETLTTLDLPNDYNQLVVRADETQPRENIVALAARVRNDLEKRGYVVTGTMIPPVPGRLFFADSVQSMMLLLGALGLTSLFSSAVLVVTTMSALLAYQTREIGVMKAIGAPTQTLLQMYLATVLLFSAAAIVLAIPLGALGSYLLVIFSTDILNLLPVSFQVVPGAVGLQIVAGLVIPLGAALSPILAGSRITVRAAITTYGLGGGNFGASPLDRVVEKLRALPRPLLLSLRNAFRRKGRLLLTLTTLIASGAVFMAVSTVSASMSTTLTQMNAFRQADADILLARPERLTRMEREAANVEGVQAVEGWGWGEADLRRAAAGTGEQLQVFGVPPDTRAILPTLLEGRWFVPQDQNAMVVDAEVLKTIPDLRIGDRLILKRNGNESLWEIIGVTRDRMRGPLGYVPYPAWTRTQNETGEARRIQIFTTAHDGAAQADIARAVESQFKGNDMDVVSAQTTADAQASDESNFGSILGFLTAMGILLAFVGGLGLMGTMGINVLERTREIGVLRAIGAPTPSLLQIVIVEGVVIGAMSFPMAVLLSLPLATLLNDLVGRQMLQASLAFTFSYAGLAVWFGLVVVIAAVASFLPAWNAIRLTVRDALAYE